MIRLWAGWSRVQILAGAWGCLSSRLTLGPSQLPIQCVLRGLSLVELQSVCNSDHSLTSRMSRAVLPHPIYTFIACAGTLFLFYSYVITIPCLILVRTNTIKYLSFLIHQINTNFLHTYWYYCGLSASLRIYHNANFSSCLPPCAARTFM